MAAKGLNEIKLRKIPGVHTYKNHIKTLNWMRNFLFGDSCFDIHIKYIKDIKRTYMGQDKRLLEKKMHKLKVLGHKKLASRRGKVLSKPPREPRYDEVYYEGLAWLNSLS